MKQLINDLTTGMSDSVTTETILFCLGANDDREGHIVSLFTVKHFVNNEHLA